MGDEHLDTILATESDEVIKYSVENLVPIPSESEGIPDSVCDMHLCNNPTPLEAFKEHSKTIIDFNNDYSSSDDNSYENIDYVDASPPDSEIVSLEVVEIVIPEVRGIDDDILLTIKDDILLFLYILNLFLEETNTFDNSSPECKTFCFDLEENSCGSTTTRSDYSLPDYESFYDDHIEEKSSGNTTTHAAFSQYDSFIFDLSINPFPPTDRSDFYRVSSPMNSAHIIIFHRRNDHFYFKIEPELGNLTIDVVGDIFPTREPRVHVPNVLPTHPTLHLDMDFILLSEPLFAYIVWIFLPFLTYPVAPPYLLLLARMRVYFLMDPASRLSFFYAGCISSEWNFHEIQCLSKLLEWKSDEDFIFHLLPHGLMNSGRVELVTRLTKTRRFMSGNPCLSILSSFYLLISVFVVVRRLASFLSRVLCFVVYCQGLPGF
ncbi:hypothetical protein Tco_0040471 [Tanacetum coccineum]